MQAMTIDPSNPKAFCHSDMITRFKGSTYAEHEYSVGFMFRGGPVPWVALLRGLGSEVASGGRRSARVPQPGTSKQDGSVADCLNSVVALGVREGKRARYIPFSDFSSAQHKRAPATSRSLHVASYDAP